MRILVRALDTLLRRVYGIFEFCDDEACLLRLRVTRAPHAVPLPDGEVRAGAPVLEPHLWNEHMPPIPPEGADVAWAVRTHRMLVDSLPAVAYQIRHDPRLTDVQAIGGVTVLVSPGDHPAGGRLAKRLGFALFPYRNPLGRFGEFWENLYTWALMWAFNAPSLRRWQLVRLRRTEAWISVAEFLRRYDKESEGVPTLTDDSRSTSPYQQ